MSQKLIQVEDYEPLIGREAVERLRKKTDALEDLHITHINSTYYGGGVAEILLSLTLLMNTLGIKTGWRTIQGHPDFFNFTKKMHNALQGQAIHMTERKEDIYEWGLYENSIRNHLDHDLIVVHDPQPLALINFYQKKSPWIWRCHLDLSNPNQGIWDYLVPFIEKYDAVIFSFKEYAQKLNVPQYFMMPAIDPFSLKNKELSPLEIDERLNHYKIPTDLPLVVQVSRFDRWKDPEGVIKAFQLARKKVDCTLILIGNAATDDPEGKEVFESLLSHQEERILILASGDDTALINSLQRKATVVVQKSIREGFGLTVTEAMWKGTPVIGGNVGGIRCQIENGKNGFLVSSIEEAAERIVQVVTDSNLRVRLGQEAKETVKKKFLLTRYLEEHLDLYKSLLSAGRKMESISYRDAI